MRYSFGLIKFNNDAEIMDNEVHDTMLVVMQRNGLKMLAQDSSIKQVNIYEVLNQDDRILAQHVLREGHQPVF